MRLCLPWRSGRHRAWVRKLSSTSEQDQGQGQEHEQEQEQDLQQEAELALGSGGEGAALLVSKIASSKAVIRGP